MKVRILPGALFRILFGDVAQWNQSSSLRTRWLKVRVLPSLPNFSCGDECKASSNQFFKLILAGSSPAFPAKAFRGRLIGRTAGSEPVNRGSNPFPEAKLQSVPQRLYGLALGASIRRFKSCRSDQIFGSRLKVCQATLNLEPGTLNLAPARVAKSAKAPVLETGY